MSLSLRRDRHRPRARRLTRAKSPGTAGGRGRVAAKRIGLLENLDRTPAQRHPMLAPALHARAGDNPDGGVAIDLAPGREPHVGGEPRSAPKTRRRASCRPTPPGSPDDVDGAAHLGVAERGLVLDAVLLAGQAPGRAPPPPGLSGRCSMATAHFMPGANPLTHPSCGFGLGVPDGREDVQPGRPR